MSGPQKSVILGIEAGSYRPLLDAVHAMATKYEQHVSTFKGYVEKPGGTAWEGQTAEAGQANAGDGWKVAARIQDLDTKFQTTAGMAVDHTIVPELINCQQMIHNAESQRDKGVTLTEDLVMGYNPPPGISEKLAEENAQLVKVRGEELKESARKWYEAEQEVKRLAEGVMRDIENEVNSAAGTFDIGKAVKDTAPRKPDTAQDANFYKDWYPKKDDPASTQAASATASGDTINYKELYPKTTVDGHQLGSLGAMGVREGDPAKPAKLAPTLADRDVPAFKEITRQNLINAKVPADQIEQRVNDAVKAAQAPRFLPDADPMRTPGEVPLHNSPGDQFNDIVGRANDEATKTIDGQIEQAKILTGQAGPGAPGVAEAWKQVGLGAAQQVHELTSDPLAAPKMGIEQAKEFYNHPGEFIGKNLIHGTEALAGGAVGGEAAAGARGLLGDLTGTEGRALTHGLDDGPTIEHHTPQQQVEHPAPSVDHPTGHLDPHGEPGSFGYDDDGNRLRYANGRPPYGSTQEIDVWNQSREDQLQRIDNQELNLPRPGEGQQWTLLHPNGPIGDDWTVENGHRLVDWQEGQKRDGLWDMGHNGGIEYRKLRELYLNHEIDFDEFMGQYQNHENYSVQDPYRNRSHIDEHP